MASCGRQLAVPGATKVCAGGDFPAANSVIATETSSTQSLTSGPATAEVGPGFCLRSGGIPRR